MRAVILEDEVHAGCGGKIRERVYDDPATEVARIERLKQLVEYGHIDMKEFEERKAKPGPKGPRQLECLYCGAETVTFGKDTEAPLKHIVKTVAADAYGGRILGAT